MTAIAQYKNKFQCQLFNLCRAELGGDCGDHSPLKPTKVTLFTMTLYNSENNDIKPFCRPLVFHNSVVKYTASRLQ